MYNNVPYKSMNMKVESWVNRVLYMLGYWMKPLKKGNIKEKTYNYMVKIFIIIETVVLQWMLVI